MSFYHWKFQIARKGKDYQVKREDLESRLDLFQANAENCVISIGSDKDCDICMAGLAGKHISLALKERKLAIVANAKAQVVTKKANENLNTGQDLVLDMKPENYNHRILFDNGAMITGKFSREGENINKDMQKSLETIYGPITKINEGGTCLIYKTEENKVLKILRPSLTGNKKVIKRFWKAARKLKKIKSDSFIKIYKVEKSIKRSLFYVVMDYFKGETLENYLARKGPLTIEEAKLALTTIAYILAVFENYGYSFRNLTPENVLIGENGAFRTTGFFLLKTVEASDLTMVGTRMVVKGYSSPEQIKNPKAAKIWGDMFSLGAIFHKMLAGETPISATKSHEYEEKLLASPPFTPESIQDTTPHLPLETCKIISSLLDFNPKKRPKPRKLIQILKQQETLAANEVSVEDKTAPEVSKRVIVKKKKKGKVRVKVKVESPLFSPTRKKAAAMLLLVFLVGLWNFKRAKALNIEYSKYLPRKTQAVFVFESLGDFAQKINLEAYPTLYKQTQQLVKQTLKDTSISKFFESSSVDFNKPLGAAFLGTSKEDLRTVFFVAMADKKKFLHFCKNLHQYNLPKFIETKIGRRFCLVDSVKNPKTIIFPKKKYCYIYTGFYKGNLKSVFRYDMLDRRKKLSKRSSFKNALKETLNKGDGYLYLDMNLLHTLVKEKTGVEPQSLQKDMLSNVFSWEITDNIMSFFNYLYLKRSSSLENLYKGNTAGPTGEFLQKIVGNPSFCLFASNNIERSWKELKGQPLGKNKMGATNTTELLQMLQKQISDKLKIEIDLEQEVILNAKGQLLFTFYSISKSKQKITFDSVLAISLKNGAQTWQTLRQILEKKSNEKLSGEFFEVNGAPAYNFSFTDAKLALTPVVGLVQNCLIFTSTKERFTKIAKNQVETSLDLDITETTLATGFLKIADLWKQFSKDIDPSMSKKMGIAPIMENLKIVRWDSFFQNRGLYQTIFLETGKDIFTMALTQLEKQQKKSIQMRQQWRELMKLPEKTLPEKMDKLQALKDFKEYKASGSYASIAQRRIFRLEFGLKKEAQKAYNKIASMDIVHLPKTWPFYKSFPGALKSLISKNKTYGQLLEESKKQILKKAKEALQKENTQLKKALLERKPISAYITSAWGKERTGLTSFLKVNPNLKVLFQENLSLQKQIEKKINVYYKSADVLKRKFRQLKTNYQEKMGLRDFSGAKKVLKNLKNLPFQNTSQENFIKGYVALFEKEHQDLQKLLQATKKKIKRLGNTFTAFTDYKGKTVSGAIINVTDKNITLKTLKKTRITLEISKLETENIQRFVKQNLEEHRFILGALYFYERKMSKAAQMFKKLPETPKINWELYK